MVSWFLKWYNTLPTPRRWAAGAIVAVLLISLTLFLFGQAQSCGYNRARTEYEQKEKELKAESDRLIAEAEAKERRIAELETQVPALKAIVEALSKKDEELINAINEAGREAAEAEANAETPSNCHDRTKRVCDLLRANGIKHDCNKILNECLAASAG